MHTPDGNNTSLPAAPANLVDLWEKHVQYEFATCNTEDTLATMVEDAQVTTFQS